MPPDRAVPYGLQRLDGSRVLVTGASGAFGSATLDVLRHLGAEVAGLDRKPGRDVLACDLTDSAQTAEAVREAVARLGGLDRLIHYAGIGPAVDAGAPPDADVYEAIEVNLLGVWRVTGAAMPALQAARGRTVITASLLAGLPLPFTAAYTVSKRALTAYADTLRAEYGTRIGVTTVFPGYVDTPIHDRSRAAGVSLDGLVPAERVRNTVVAVLRAAAARRAPRDVASTPLGTVALHLLRHLPGAVDRAVAFRVAQLARSEHFHGPLAEGLRLRHRPPTTEE